MSPPLVLCRDASALQEEAERLRACGWKVLSGLEAPSGTWDLAARRLVATGVVRDEAGVVAAVLAAVRGAGVVVAAVEDTLAARLYDELRRLGPVSLPDGAERGDAPRLGGVHRRLLELVGDGLTVTEAARALFLSRRTADRRLAEVRRALGARTTAEALARFKRAG